MPIYEYRCPAGHNMNVLCKYEERQESVSCCEAGAMTPQFSAPAVTVRGSQNPVRPEAKARPTINERGTGLTLIDWTCDACQKSTYDVYVERPDAKPTCECGATMREVVGFPDTDWFTKACSGNPNGLWSDAAQRYFTSKQDRLDWMAANNLVDGNDVDSDAVMRRDSEARRANDEYCANMVAEFDRDPAMRQLRDEGRIADWEVLRPGRDVL